ncbi:hypothetical protein QYE76_039037 [Lolium multiflorum]|uniref:GAG-pre-integrase domain-containing protein n=1 Tax=Lolium multiflorum TaxID=4521 RepID=A0AAD8T8X3_LOLMU|nr:hypothetical protein QYE76_039037 [Lolium multiflorum]
MTGDRRMFSTIDGTVTGTVKFGDGSVVEICGKGSIMFMCKNQGHRVLTEVYLIPRLRSNIINIGQLDEIGCKTVVEDGEMCIFDPERLLLAKVRRSSNRLYKLPLEITSPVCLVAKGDDMAWRWHARYGHLHFRALHDLVAKDMVAGMPAIDREQLRHHQDAQGSVPACVVIPRGAGAGPGPRRPVRPYLAGDTKWEPLLLADRRRLQQVHVGGDAAHEGRGLPLLPQDQGTRRDGAPSEAEGVPERSRWRVQLNQVQELQRHQAVHDDAVLSTAKRSGRAAQPDDGRDGAKLAEIHACSGALLGRGGENCRSHLEPSADACSKRHHTV